MSRNEQQGKYAGKLNGKHYRTRGVNNIVSTFDCNMEMMWRQSKLNRRCLEVVLPELNRAFGVDLGMFFI
jgi:hypothetical protein